MTRPVMSKAIRKAAHSREPAARQTAPHQSALKEARTTIRSFKGHDPRAWAEGVLATYLDGVERDQALDNAADAIRSMSDSVLRAYAFAGLAVLASPSRREAFVREAFTFVQDPELDQPCEHPVNTLASFLPRDLVPDALNLIRSFGVSHSRFSAIAKILHNLEKPEREPIVRDELALLASQASPSYHHLACLGPFISQPLWPVAVTIINAMDDTYLARAIEETVPYASDEVLPDLLRVSARVGYDRSSLAPLLARLPKHLLSELIDTKFRSGRYEHIGVLANIASHLPEKARTIALGKALAALPGIENEGLRALALQKLAPHLSGDLAEKAKMTARAFSEPDRSQTLVFLAHQLSARERYDACSTILTTLREYHDDPIRLIRFEDIIPILPPSLMTEAISTIQIFEDKSERFQALKFLVDKIAGPFPKSLIQECLNLAFGMQDDFDTVGLLCAIAPRCSVGWRDRIFLQAIKTACELPWQYFPGPVDAIRLIAPVLPASLLPKAFMAIRQIENEDARASAFFELSAGLSSQSNVLSKREPGEVIWVDFRLAGISRLRKAIDPASIISQEALLRSTQIVEYSPPLGGGMRMKKVEGSTDDAKWGKLIDEAAKEIGLAQFAKMILGRASPEERALISGMMTNASAELLLENRPEVNVGLTVEEMEAFKRHSDAHPWKPKSGISASAFIREKFAPWLGRGLRRADVAGAQPSLGTAYAKEIERHPERRLKDLLESPRNLPAGTPPPVPKKRWGTKRLAAELGPEELQAQRSKWRETARKRRSQAKPA